MSEETAAAVLVVDRSPEVAREVLAYLTDRGYAVEWVDDGEKAFNRLDTRRFDVLVTELNVRRVDGMKLMAVAKDRNPDVCVVFIAERPDIELATEAMRRGAYDFQIKPLNLGKLEAVVQRGLEYQRLVLRQYELRRRLDEQYGLGSLVGNSRQMVRLYTRVRETAPTHDPVLIVGEPGAGKDLIAQALHNNSLRRDEAFVKLRCQGSAPAPLDRALFGGAEAGPGRIELADKGTLYLDGVSGLAHEQQRAVAVLIERGRTRRIGSPRAIGVDVRVVASSETPLAGAGLAPELAALLENTVIEVPPLRDRVEDIPLLVEHFLRETAREEGLPVTGTTRHALDLLMRYEWPGNVRELQNVVRGLLLVVRGDRPIEAYDIPHYIRRAARPATPEIRLPLGASMADAEKLLIEETLKWAGYNKETCAKTLGIGLRTLYRKIKQYEIR